MTRINDIFEGFSTDDLAYIEAHGMGEFAFLFIGRARRAGHQLTMNAEQVCAWLERELRWQTA